MNILKTFLPSIFLSVSLLGCANQPGWKPFSPPPEAYERWRKAGADHIQIQAALLECGLPAPFSGTKFFKDVPYKESLELYARTTLCMDKSGFELLPGLSVYCEAIPSLKSCRPENSSLIPSRSVERRLNSAFCKDPIYAKDKVCQP